MMLRKYLYLFPVFILLSAILCPALSGAEDQSQPVLQAANRPSVAWVQRIATRDLFLGQSRIYPEVAWSFTESIARIISGSNASSSGAFQKEG
jgi:hypothetical protein